MKKLDAEAWARRRRCHLNQSRLRQILTCGSALAAVALGALLPRAQAAGILSQGSVSVAPVASSIASNLANEQQGQAVAARAQSQLSQITKALQAMQNLQATAQNLAVTAPTKVPNGLQTGGLVPNSGLAATGVANPVKWTGAQTPVQSSAAGGTTVSINQTAAKALLSWNSFNVGRNTTVAFNQHGNTNWVALNRIAASGVPSQILGSIKASGQVYLINPNGIIFGGASQVNVGSLVASAAAISNSQFFDNGIYSTNSGTYAPSFTDSKGAIIVQPGAAITTSTPALVTTGGGFVLLLGKQVKNGGAISTPDGQTELAAGDDFVIRPGYSTTSNDSSTTRGNEIAVALDKNGSSLKSGGSGLVENFGEITAATGDITLAGETVQQNGMALSTTSVAVRGTIHLLTSASDPSSSVTLGNNGYTLIEPDLSSTATGLDSQRAGLIADSTTANGERAQFATGQFDDLSLLGDQEEASRIEIVSGNTVEFKDGSDSAAPGGQIAVSAVKRVQVDKGALLDVSGSYAVPMAMSSNDIAVNIQNYELRDNPQNRLTGALSNNTVYVDAQKLSLVPSSAADANVRDYTAGGLFEVSGYLANIGHRIGEYTALGGTIALSAGTGGSTGAIVAQAGATFNIDGGSLQYQSGYLQQSYLLGTNGQIYNVNNAPANITYAGVYDGFTVDHARWSVTQNYGDLLKAPGEIYQTGYTVGRAAGTLTLSSPTTIFDGTVDAGTANGPSQTSADPVGVTDAYLYTQSEVAEPGTLNIAALAVANLALTDTNVAFGGKTPEGVGITTKIPKDLGGTTILNAAVLNKAGLGALTVMTDGSIDITSALTFAPGAQVSLYGSSIDIASSITASGGSVTASQLAPGDLVAQLQTRPANGKVTGDIELGAAATINTAGLWTNLSVDPDVTFTQAFINGGAVDLASTNNLTLKRGSVIDASAGGYVGLTGTVKGGAGGAITLEAAIQNPDEVKPVGDLKLGGRLESIGATQGGALTLYAPSFYIAGKALTAANAAVVWLDPAFFSQGFSAYNLQSTSNITVAPGTVVNVTEPTYQTETANLSAPTGVLAAKAFTVALDPLYVPNSADTAITQRAGASFSAQIVSPTDIFSSASSFIDKTTLSIGTGAAIKVDPGQSIDLQSVSQLTIDGSLSAPGGTISATSLFDPQAKLPGPGIVSVWVGSKATLNTSSQAVSFENAAGNRISLAPSGGTITLGGVQVGTFSSVAAVIIRKGAVLKASGSEATDEVAASFLGRALDTAQPTGKAITVEGAGGSISLASEEGIYNDGTLFAAAGGPNAAGGSLAMTLEADFLPDATDTLEATPRIITITQNDPGSVLAASLTPGSSKGLKIGTAAISAQQIALGGFGSVTLYARDAFLFKGNVTLKAPQAISLEQGHIADSSKRGSVTLNAPYVLLSGNTPQDLTAANTPVSVITGFSAQTATGAFTVNAATIDINNALRFGGLLPADGKMAAIDLAGFGTVNLNSRGDLQFVTPNAYGGNGAAGDLDNLVTTANINITAREIYAMGSTGSQTGDGVDVASALIAAGYKPAAIGTTDTDFKSNGVLTIRRMPGTTPSVPDTLAGQLTLVAAKINQGGVIWQPLGSITFGVISPATVDGVALNGDPNGVVNFLKTSLSSVSAAGLNIPFGGTTDGVNYQVDGAQLAISNSSSGLNTVSAGIQPGTITVAALKTDIQSGAALDLQGGGTLTGAGFISGEGGSTDVLITPLLSVGSSGVSQPSLAANPVYAIVTGAQASQAIAYGQSGAAGSVPALGQQIVIPAGIPGLPAGTYTLLPAQYALEPGGYRVELDGAAGLTAAPVVALPNGSYAVAGYTALADTHVRGTLATNLTITPRATVLNYADYDQESYNAFLTANAARLDELRPVLPLDAGTLVLNLPTSSQVSVADAGSVAFAAAEGGIGGTLQIGSGNAGDFGLPDLDFYGSARDAKLPKGTVSLSASQIDAFNPFILEIGIAGGGSNAGVNSITLEKGATLKAARVILTAQAGGITLKSGSGINTIGQGTLPVDSTTEGLLNNNGATVLDVGNGYLVYGTSPSLGATYGPITVANGAKIYTDGSIDFSTSAAVNIGINASYGGKYIDLAVPVINIGDSQALGSNAPAGVSLTQAVLQALTRGIAAQDVPAVQIVNLTAFDSLNLYGSAALDLSNAGVQLEINTPAIYGYGGASDVASIGASTIVWNGIPTLDATGSTYVSGAPGATYPNGPGSGSGTLDLNAQTIILGYSGLDKPVRDISLARLAVGFSNVDLNASSEITADNQSTLAVYQKVATYGQPGSGGALNLNTPLLTAENEAVIGFTAGNDIEVNSPAGSKAVSSLVTEAAGGEIDLSGANIGIDSAVILPSGKLNLQAADDITLGAGSLLNLAGAVTTNVNETIYGFGGDLVMQSAGGNITQNAGSVIDVAATGNIAGSVSATATGAGKGKISLLGTLTGASTGGYAGGQFTIRAQSLGDFALLNTSLDAGGFFQSRSFDIKQGDLTIGNGVRAQNVSVSLDNGSLSVTGLIDASGNGGGAIDLAASEDLTLASTAVLDAHGTKLQTDSYGQAIASVNSPAISLTAGSSTATASGTLTLSSGAVIDLASADAVARGDLELNAPRAGTSGASATQDQTIPDPLQNNATITTGANGPAGAQGNDIAISATTGIRIIGASSIALNGTATYQNAPTDAKDGVTGQIIDQAYLNLVNKDSQAFITQADANSALAGRIAGLSAYGSAFHLRPGVQIVSATADGDLTVEGDINLAGYRYGPGVIASQYGSGDPGTLAIRAGGSLNIYGSITDGFEQPVSDAGTEFADGWVIYGGGEPYGHSQVIPIALTITAGSSLPADAVVSFAVPVAAGGSFTAGAIAPVRLTVDGDQAAPTAFTATSNILNAAGRTLFKQGQIVPAGAIIPDGAIITRGGTLPFAVTVAAVTWPANTPLAVTTTLADGFSIGVQLGTNLSLKPGAIIPAGSLLDFDPNTPGLTVPNDGSGDQLTFADGTPLPETVNTRLPGVDGSQGQLYGLAKLLPQGDKSWSINLVAGADTAAAGAGVVQAASALHAGGNLVLADTHYGISIDDSQGFSDTLETVVPAFSVVRTGTGSLSLAAGGSIDEDSSFGIYSAGAQSQAILDSNGQNPYDLAQGTSPDGTVLGANNTDLAALIANYAAYYPTGGGNVLVDAQGNLNSFISTSANPSNPELSFVAVPDSDALGNWLWQQGGAGQPGAWWVEYGSLNLGSLNGSFLSAPFVAEYSGFQGIGTLGGGNLTVVAGGNASPLDLAVASNGRVTANGTLVQDGGGTLNVSIGGAVNFTTATNTPSNLASAHDADGIISDLRGDTVISAASIGTIQPIYGTAAAGDTRFLSPLDSEQAGLSGGFDLAPGDGTVTIDTRGDVAIGDAINPGTVQNYVNTTPVNDAASGGPTSSGGVTEFSLWTGATSISLFSAGGDVAPAESTSGAGSAENDFSQALYTPSLLATAQNGSIYFGQSEELAPSLDGQLELLAANSIIGFSSSTSTDATVSISGAALSDISSPFDPAIVVANAFGNPPYTNRFSGFVAAPFDFGLDNVTSPLHSADTQPALIYAATGDILDIGFGTYFTAALSPSGTQQVVAAKPFDIFAGRDIVDSGTLNAPDIFLNLKSVDVTSITAGRDIIESSFDVAGPGNLVIQTGRNLYEADQGGIDSIGPLFDINPAARNSGASISVLAGTGAGPDYAGFATEFLSPASGLGLDDASTIIQANDATLYSWLRTNAGYSGKAAEAYSFFQTLPAERRDVFLRLLYFDILNSSGLEFNQPSSNHYRSYVLGKDAIASLFPANVSSAATAPDTGDITMFGGSGIQTLFGGSIQTLTPGGETLVGVEGAAPPSTAGFITQGSGDIDIYAQDSVLLGESRVMTTFGGNIVVWSALGNINAGRGSKTTIDFTPVQRVYDNYGDVFLSPTVPSSGAGIATLAPIPGVPAGNINLVAPVGTVDAGEAGIRGSGNLNIAALHVLNAANIQVQGSTTGVPTAVAPDIGALTSASSAAGAAAAAAANSTTKQHGAPLPSIWIVEILGYGNGAGQAPPAAGQPAHYPEDKRKARQVQTISSLSAGPPATKKLALLF